MISNQLLESVARQIGDVPARLTLHPVHGGCIGQSYKITTGKKVSYFLKTTSERVPADFFAKEAEGLTLLQRRGLNYVPEIIAVASDFLLLQWIEQGAKTNEAMRKAGESLAQLHRQTNTFYGLENSNYIGSEPQVNGIFNVWHECYFHSKLWPMAKRANDKGHLFASTLSMLEKLENKLQELLPDEPASLLHGDLWSGNLVVSCVGLPYFIDPAAYYGHREVDLAMTLLFGGFTKAFYEAYQASFPLLPDFRKRIPLYQLYPLLVHAAIFGYSYQSQCIDCIQHYL